MAREFVTGKCFALFNPREMDRRRTFCVMGSPRGGTSMAAGLLRLLGVFMGETLDPDNNEDQAFIAHRGNRRLFRDEALAADRQAYLDQVRGVIAARNEAHAVWGWKDPISTFYIEAVEEQLVDPCYLVVYRDALAVALGEHVKNGADPLNALGVTAESYVEATRIIRRHQAPLLCISYEKALQNGGELVTCLAGLAGVDLEPRDVRRLADYIQPNRNTGRTWINSARVGAARRLHAVESALLGPNALCSTLAALVADSGGVPPRFGEYAYRLHQEHALFVELIRLIADDRREATQRQLAIMAVHYEQVFGIALYETEAILAGRFADGELPHLLVPYLFHCGIASMIHDLDQASALEHFRSAHRLALYYLQQGIGEVSDIGADYLWQSKYHEGLALRELGRRAEASEIRLFIAAVHEARRRGEGPAAAHPAAQYLGEALFELAMKELP